mgnify:CR=1
MRHFLSLYFKQHYKTMRRVDFQQHIEGALTRAYIPTIEESQMAAIRRLETYQALNGHYHGEVDLQAEIDSREHTKWTRVKWLIIGKPKNRNLEKAE